MPKKTLCIILSSAVLLPLLCIGAKCGNVTVSAQSAVVINADTCEVLYEKNPYERRGIASTTKIMTSLVALENGNLSDTVKVKAEDVAVEGTSIGLKSGDEISLETLVAGMLLESGNDAANVTATMIAGGKDEFCTLMNRKAAELGLSDTNFKNPSGLTEDGHYSTAYDMAVLTRAALKNRKFSDICSARNYKVAFGTPKRECTFYNHNKFLKMFDGAIGVKTGFTKAAGRCLVTAARRDGITLVAVTLNAPDDWNDHIKMFEYSFEKVALKTAEFDENSIKIPVVGSDEKFASVKLTAPLTFACATGYTDYETAVYTVPFLYVGVSANECVGWVELKSTDGNVITTSYLVCANDISKALKQQESDNWFEKIINRIREGLSSRQT